MKIRNGFVSNSSSSSFVVKKEGLSRFQIYAIVNHSDFVKKHKSEFEELQGLDEDDLWAVEEKEDKIELWTDMDNFDMSYFLDFLEVPKENIDGGKDNY